MRTRIDQLPTVGEMLKAARLQAGMTRPEVSRRAGHTPENICQWEHGQHRPRSDSFVNVANACGYRVVLEPMGDEK